MTSQTSQTSQSRTPATGPTTHSFTPAKRVQSFGASVFGEFTTLAHQHDAVNLGQGFPNFAAPDFIKRAAQRAIDSDLNQYARSPGQLSLVQALAATYSPLYGRELDPMTEIVVTDGATEGIFVTLQALVDPGDEVILIEPFYDSYPASVIMAGGAPVYVPLRAPSGATSPDEWTLDMDELAAAITPRTRLLILNTPQNPVGKVFTRTELEQIAALAQAHDFYVLSDEVYEWMVYPRPVSSQETGNDGATRSGVDGEVHHVRIATLPGMWERTITLGSAGKTFSVTGWKIGWAIAPAHLAHAIFMGHQWIAFAVATPLQEAVAAALTEAPQQDYYNWLAATYQNKRDKLLRVLQEVGLTPVSPDGSYFILFATDDLDVPVEKGRRRDFSVCRWFTSEAGVTAIPPSPFYSPAHQHLTDNLARFCFCKTDDMLDAAAERLRARLG